MADKFNLEGFSVSDADVCTADGGFVGDVTGNLNIPVTFYTDSAAISLSDGMAILSAPFLAPKAYTLAIIGATEGQIIRIVATDVIADTATLTPVNLSGGTTISFDADSESVELTYSSADGAGKWYITSLNGATVA